MNSIYKAYCRTYQFVMRAAACCLPWRKPELIEGKDSLKRLPAVIKEKGIPSVLIVTDKGLMSLGMLDPLFDGLKQEGVEYRLYDKTVPNPTIDNIEEGVQLYKEGNCAAIIAFGGGSPMDCAKGIGARIARPGKPIAKMKGVLKVLRRLPPIFAVPTTAGTGSEATLAAVITNSATHEKYPINDVVLIPKYAVLDPMLTVKLPKHITSTTGVDALTHAVEAYIGHSTTKETRAMSLKATELIFANLKKAYDDGEDIEARQNMQYAAFYAGVAFTRSYVGYVHAIAHTLGGFYNVPHGLANAIILPYVLEYYGDSCAKQLAELAAVAGVGTDEMNDSDRAKAFIAAIKELNASMQIPAKVKGIKEEDIPLMVSRAFAEANPLYPVPKFMGKEEIAAMYRTIAE